MTTVPTAPAKPLYLLPFDHRHSYIKGMFHWDPPLSDAQHDQVAASKQLIYDGFKTTVGTGLAHANAGILVDEEFGAALLHDAQTRGFVTAVSVEKSGQDDFQFEYGDDFAAHIEAFHPNYAKVLVRYNPGGDAAVNAAQRAQLKKLSDYCQRSGCGFMFELLVPATATQLASAQGDKKTYDLELRCDLMRQAIGELQDAGIEPTLWKIEGLDQRADCARIVAQVQRGGRQHAHCIVLGRGADIAQVEHWLGTAASVAGFIGFAVGRTTFWDAVTDFEAQKITRPQAVAYVAERYRRWIRIFEQGLRARSDADRLSAIPAASTPNSAGGPP